MKLRIEISDDLPEDEVLIRCGRVDEKIQKIQQYILEQITFEPKISFYKDNQEFFIPLEKILFFETENEVIYAHTANDAYKIKYRLYELEKMLPRQFIRASKSAILNIMQVYSVSRNLTASSLVQFNNSHKQVYVSRHYFKEMKLRLNERSKL